MTLLRFLRRNSWPDVAEVLLRALDLPGLTEKLAREWSLVLTSRGVPHRIRRGPLGKLRLQVPPARRQEALAELAAYLAENPPQDFAADHAPDRDSLAGLPGVLWSLGIVTALMTMTGAGGTIGAFGLDWQDRGLGDTGLMQAGQWWRAVTALTLHADVAHLMGNVCLGGVFLLLLAGEMGLGAAWFLTLLSGVLGNLAKVWLQGPGYLFLGGSTAVFGALGVLAGVRLKRSRPGAPWRRAMPFAAGLMLLAMLGAGEGDETKKIDLVGHVMGFMSGGLLGLGYAWGESFQGRSWRGVSPWLGLAAAFMAGLAWAMALSG